MKTIVRISILFFLLFFPIAAFSDDLATGTVTVDATKAVPLAAADGRIYKWLLVQADAANTVNVLIGNSSNQYMKLVPGVAAGIDISNVEKIYVKSATTGSSTIHWIGRY